MIFRLSILSLLLFAGVDYSFSQAKNEFERIEFKDNVLKMNENSSRVLEIKNVSQTRKNAGLAMLMSFVLPGAGHYYINRMDVGKYFVAGEAASWLGLLGMNIYGDAVRDDSRKFATEHAQVSSQGKNDDYFASVGNYNNIYEYNDDKLRRGEYDLLYDVNAFYWNWDGTINRDTFEKQRKSSERIYNSRVIFASALIVNRIISGISALIIANSQNSSLSSIMVDPQVTYDNDLRIDGFRLNVIGNINF